MKIRWGVIGAGGIAVNRTIPGMLASGSSTVAAVMRTDERKLAEVQARFPMAQGYVSVSEMLRDSGNLDAVYIASPVKFHLEHALACAAAGKPMLIEKPIGMNLGELEAIREACENAGVFFDGALMMRYHALHRKMRDAVRAGVIGDVVSIRMSFCFRYPEMAGAWRQRKEIGGGGVFMDLGPHCLDLVQFVSGRKIKRVAAFMDTMTFTYEVEDSASVLAELEGGGHALLSMHFNIPEDVAETRFDVYGTEGALLAGGTLGQEERGTLRLKRTGTVAAEEIQYEAGNLYAKEIDGFAELMNNRCRWSEAMDGQQELQRTLDAVYEAASLQETNGEG
ncbi:Gfo/Idh/MocA family protein [Paenibacillus contaminans]|uniref:Gfo/Idh/MocA family oxidoreductase n=1 Tax=Paenibacillus contaminans TaxID=450362 RepID=A0A329MRM5_9BACL|nr:Gfo/Idh/MocA family oxidoreductase [Paenibacillus contaminans]RAV22444.1 hypothetical protein DQG23_05760 [Paenibacillus contaminans]